MSIFHYKKDLVDNLLVYLRKNNISKIDKKKIYNILTDLRNITDKQNESFCRYYGIINDKKERIVDISRATNRRESSIRQSITGVVIKLYIMPIQDFLILEKIYKKYQFEEYSKLYSTYKSTIKIYKKNIS